MQKAHHKIINKEPLNKFKLVKIRISMKNNLAPQYKIQKIHEQQAHQLYTSSIISHVMDIIMVSTPGQYCSKY